MSIEKNIERIADALEHIAKKVQTEVVIEPKPGAVAILKESKTEKPDASIVGYNLGVPVHAKTEEKKEYSKSERTAMLEELKSLGIIAPARQSSVALFKKLEVARLNAPTKAPIDRPNDPLAEVDAPTPASEEADLFSDVMPEKEITGPVPLTDEQTARCKEGLRRIIAMNIEKLGKDGANNVARNVLKLFGVTKIPELNSESYEKLIAYIVSKGIKV